MRRRDLISRTGLGLSVVAGIAWVISLGASVTYFGDNVTLAYLEGYVAIYWGSDTVTRNSGVLNAFTWPYFGGGAGMEWTPAWRWQSYGPGMLLSRKGIEYDLEYPKRLGFHLPGAGRSTYGYYVGAPMWPIVLVGASAFVAFRRARRSCHHRCSTCGYDTSGLNAARCPECGVVISPRGVQ